MGELTNITKPDEMGELADITKPDKVASITYGEYYELSELFNLNSSQNSALTDKSPKSLTNSVK